MQDLSVTDSQIEQYYAKSRRAGLTDEQIDHEFSDLMCRSYEEILRANDIAAQRQFENETIHFMGRYQTQFKETAGDPSAWEGPERVRSLRADLELVSRHHLSGRNRNDGYTTNSERLRRMHRMYVWHASGKKDMRELWVLETIGNVTLGMGMNVRPRLVSSRSPGPVGRAGNTQAPAAKPGITRWTVRKGENGGPPTVKTMGQPKVRPMNTSNHAQHREVLDATVPNLKGDYEVLEPPTSRYNCFGYSRGQRSHAQLDRLWGREDEIRPSVQRFYRDAEGGPYQLMERMDFTHEPGKQKVAVYGQRMPNGDVIPSHAAVEAADGTWHSKMGENALIRHRSPQSLVGSADAPELLFGLERRGSSMP